MCPHFNVWIFGFLGYNIASEYAEQVYYMNVWFPVLRSFLRTFTYTYILNTRVSCTNHLYTWTPYINKNHITATRNQSLQWIIHAKIMPSLRCLSGSRCMARQTRTGGRKGKIIVWKKHPVSLWRRANARNVRLYYPYWQYTNHFIFRFVSLLCLRSALRLLYM